MQLHGVRAIAEKNLLEKAKVFVAQANLSDLPFQDTNFDKALSINVGAGLQSTTQVVSENSYQVAGLGGHFQEISRVLKKGGHLVVAAPASFDVIFTDGKTDQRDAVNHIRKALRKIGKKQDPKVVVKQLNSLDGVHRATFVTRGKRLVLVTDSSDLQVGEPIWQKTPEGAVQGYYHSEEEYLVALREAGLRCEEIKRPCFFGSVKYQAYRSEKSDLGESYISNNPFTIYHVVKR